MQVNMRTGDGAIRELEVTNDVPEQQTVVVRYLQHGVQFERYGRDGFTMGRKFLTWHDLAELAVEP